MTILKNEKIESVIALVDDSSKHLYSVCDVFFKVVSWTFSLSLLGWIARMPHDLYEKVAFIIILISGIFLVCGFLFLQTIRLLRYPLRALLEIRYDRFSRGFERDSKAGCGRQHNEAAWPELHARRNAIRLI